MKALFLSLVALVAVSLTAAAQTGPKSPLYLTYVNNSGYNIVVVQGNSIINIFPEAYGPPNERPIAVWGDVRTIGNFTGYPGGQYTLNGTPTGTLYSSPIQYPGDSTSDGLHNYLVDYFSGWVYQTARDFTSPIALFNVGPFSTGITYDASNNSLWISWAAGPGTVADYSLSGTLLSSFSIGKPEFSFLALDPADHTLWLVDSTYTGNLQQYSTAGVLLSTGPYVRTALGGEFDLKKVIRNTGR